MLYIIRIKDDFLILNSVEKYDTTYDNMHKAAKIWKILDSYIFTNCTIISCNFYCLIPMECIDTTHFSFFFIGEGASL